MIRFIDLHRQREALEMDIEEIISNVLSDGSFILGSQVHSLEEELSDYVGVPCITVANGTDALYISMIAAGVMPGDEVLVPSFTWVSTAETVCQIGASPVFVDIDQNFNFDLDDARKKTTHKTKCIIPVSMFGLCANLSEIYDFANINNLISIEDAAQSFGAKSNGKLSCSFLDISTTSFFPAKPLGCYGDGGAIFVKNPAFLEKIQRIPRHGQTERYNYKEVGVNSRLDTIQAAVLLEKIKIFEDEIKKRNIVANSYQKLLSNHKFLTTPFIPDESNRCVWAQYTLLLDKDIKHLRADIMDKLKAKNIPSALYYPVPLHTSGVYKQYASSDLPRTEDYASRVISIPMHPYLRDSEINIICSELISILDNL